MANPRRFLALWFVFLPADRWRQQSPNPAAAPADTALAFVEKRRGAMRLVAVDARAQALGLGPDMALADARAQVPELTVVDHDPSADAAWLDRLADVCLRYTPLLAINAADGLILDLTGCEHAYGGENGLAADLVARLTRLGMGLRHAIAATPEAARALARFQTTPAASEGEAIRRLPVAALRLDEEATTALVRAGLKTVGDVARRPAAGIAARFGADAVAALARLTGHGGTPLTPHRTPPRLVVERRFAEPLARTDHALAVLADMAAEAAGLLERRGHGGRRFEALFFRSDGLVRALGIETGMATREAMAIMRLFRERIETLDDTLDPGFGYDLVRLAVPLTEPLAAVQLRLEGGAVADAEVAALVDRLSTRLGRGRIRRFAPGDSHLPEQAQLLLPALDVPAAAAAWPVPDAGDPPLRPLHLFDPPQAIDVVAEVPDGPPRRFRWRRALHDVARFEGPERIAAEWWRRDQGVGLTRDYYRVEDARGRRYWLFRHGLYGSEKRAAGWYLHGVFA